jgi:LiaI-LiaF-like transmembrane region
MEPRGLRRRHDIGGLVFGGILLLVGIYYLLRQTLGFDLPELSWDELWPLLLILLGGVVLYENWFKRRDA